MLARPSTSRGAGDGHQTLMLIGNSSVQRTFRCIMACMSSETLPTFFGPYRRTLPDGSLIFLDDRGRIEWQGPPPAGLVFPPDYEEREHWWWKSTPLGVQIRALVFNHRMTVEQAAASCAVPPEAALAVLGLTRDSQPIPVDRRLQLAGYRSRRRRLPVVAQ